MATGDRALTSDRPRAAPLLWLASGVTLTVALALRYLWWKGQDNAWADDVQWWVLGLAIATNVLVWLATESWDLPWIRWRGRPIVFVRLASFAASLVAFLAPFVGFLTPGWALSATCLYWVVTLPILWTQLSGEPAVEDLVGATTIVVACAAMTAGLVAVFEPREATWLWAQALVVAGAAGIAVTMGAWDWSRRWFWVLLIVLFGVLATFVGRVGYHAERDAAVRTPITEAIVEARVLARTADDTAKEARDAAQKAISEAVMTRDAAVDALDAAIVELELLNARVFKPAAQAVYEAAMREDVDGAENLLVVLNRLDVPEVSTVQALEVRAAARAAVDAAAAVVRAEKAAVDAAAKVSEATPEPSEAVQAAIAAACREADDIEIEVDGCDTDTDTDTDTGSINEALRELHIQIAAYRNQVDASDENAAALTAAVQADPPRLDRSWAGAIAAGPPAIVDTIDRDDPLRLVPGPVGWAVLAAGALVALRTWLKLNAAQMAGPVNVTYTGDHASNLRIAVLENVKTPGAAPGSEVSQTVTDLTEKAAGASNPVTVVVNAINTVLARKTGYEIDADLSTPPTGGPAATPPTGGTAAAPAAAPAASTATGSADDAKETRVLVRVTAVTSNESLGVRSFSDADPKKAMTSAGLWAAGLLLGRSSRIPSWASWNESSAEALAAMRHRTPTLDQLERAIGHAPTSGWLLLAYGHQLEIEDRTLDAIPVYARAVTAHPRYLLARYRFAIALDELGEEKKPWNNASLATQHATIRAIRDAAARIGKTCDLTVEPGAPDEFRKFAASVLKTIERDLGWWQRLSARLRRSDRAQAWLSWRLGGGYSERDTKWLVKSALLTFPDDAKKKQVERARVEAEARRIGSSYVVAYNLACGAVIEKQHDVGIEWLERCLACHDVGDLDADWLPKDPDLKPISAHPRFQAVVATLKDWSEP